MRCVCGRREHGNGSLRPLRRGRLVVRASETKALGKSEPGAAVASQRARRSIKMDVHAHSSIFVGRAFALRTHLSWNRNQQATESTYSKRSLEVLALALG